MSTIASDQQESSSPFNRPSIGTVLNVSPVENEELTYQGIEADYPVLGVYGGHLVGQALAAGFASVADGFLCHSLHAYFLNPGTPKQPIFYRVQKLRDGKRYINRFITAYQGEKDIFTMSASFTVQESGDEHQIDAPDIPPVTDLIKAREARGRHPLLLPIFAYGVEIEPVDDWSPINPEPGEPCIQQWIRVKMDEADDERFRQCVLAYLSDGTLIFNALRPHGSTIISHQCTSLDHTLWFHRDGDPADWLLFDQHSPAARDSRGLNFGAIYNQKGELIASVAQESLMRKIDR